MKNVGLAGRAGAGALALIALSLAAGAWSRAAAPRPRAQNGGSETATRRADLAGRAQAVEGAAATPAEASAAQRPSAASDARPPSGASTSAAPADAAAAPAWRAREAELLLRIDELESELARLQARLGEQEREWTQWVRMLETLDLAALPDPPEFADPASEPSAAEIARATAARERTARALADLRALLLAEGVRDLDVLEIGGVHDEEERGWLGPVVVRLLDERGRPGGTLASDRLRLECSRTGWGVTLVFEIGFETIGGQPVPFGPPATEAGERGGVRRIHLAGVDPAPWAAAFPELLGPEQARAPDDGTWDLLRVRQEINRLLALDRRTGAWRLVALGGVVGSVLQAVHVVELDGEGAIVRRLFADRMRIARRAHHVELELVDGVQERGARSAPFLDGRYRIYLTGATASEWEDARLPGLGPPDRAPLLPQHEPAPDGPHDSGAGDAR